MTLKAVKDHVHVSDSLLLRAGGKTVYLEEEPRSVVEVKGWVKLVCRERGKIVPGTHREGHNIWTNTGREFLAQRISPDLLNGGTLRGDAVAYMGVGIGSQLEEPGVLRLNQPVVYDQDIFLADITGVDFPLYPARTTVQYQRVFSETEITTAGLTVQISELGLFTNGDPEASPANTFGSRLVSFAASWDAAPVAYKTFEAVGKTASMQLEVSWQIRF